MLTFVLGFATCYLATSALLLVYGWRCERPPVGVRGVLFDLVCALCWPLAFLGDPEDQ